MSKIFPIGAPDSDPPGVHEINQRKGWEMIRKGRQAKKARALVDDEWLSIAFHGAAIKRLMAQRGAKILRVYRAINDDGVETVVLSAADKNGKDLLGGDVVMLDDGTPCPPFCDPPPPDWP